MSLKARDLICADVPHVSAESRPADYQAPAPGGQPMVFAVFEHDTFLGLADSRTIFRHPQRIFADLCQAPAAPPIDEETPVETILAEMERRGTDILATVAADGRFLGVVSRTWIIDVLLTQARARLFGIQQLVAMQMEMGLSLSPEAVLEHTLALATRFVGARYGALGVLDAQGRLGRFLTAGIDQATREAIGRPPEHMALLGELLREGKTLRLQDLTQHAQFSAFPPHHPVMRTFLGVPIRYQGRILGNLYVADKHDSAAFTEEDELLLVALAGQAAIVIEGACLHAQAETRQSQLSAILEINKKIGHTDQPAGLLPAIAEEAARLLGASSAIVRLREGEELVVAGAYGAAAGRWVRPRLAVGESLSGQVVATGQPLLVNDLATDARMISEHLAATHGQGLSAFMGVPLKVADRIVGTLAFLAGGERRFSQEDLDLAVAFADQAVIAVENTRLFQENRRQLQALSILYEISRAITGQLDVRQLAQTIYQQVGRVMDARNLVISLYDEARQDFDMVLRLVKGEPDGHPVRRHPFGVGLASCVVSRRQSIRTANYLETCQREGVEPFPTTSPFTCWLGVPLIAGEQPIGVVALRSETQPFSEDDERLLTNIAGLAALALKSARLYAENMRAHAELAAAQEQMIRTEKLRALGEMAGGVAHDFNNTLAVILGRAQLLLKQTDDLVLQRQLRIVEQAAMDAARTVRRIQEFARVRLARPFESVDLNQVVADVVEVTRSRWQDEAEAVDIRYHVQLEVAPLPPVAGDAAELREALTNLMLNALDAMPAGGRILLRTGREETRLCCTVTDTGAGMSEEVQRRVFEPFFTTKGERGSGLGLSIVYGIITRHGGDIEVQSQRGRGTTFTIWLPLGQPVPEPMPKGPAPRAERGAKILVIDDEADVREVMVDMLTGQGHVVRGCPDGQSGLARLGQERFDLVITDLAMPGLSGWEVARRVKQDTPQTPVALITGWGDRIDPEEARAKGVDWLLAKPCRLEEVVALVSRALTLGSRSPQSL